MESQQQNESTSTSFTPSEPKLCLNGCGFFGSPSNNDLCSKCYRSICAEKSQTAAAKAAVKNSFKTYPYSHMIAEPPVVPKFEAAGTSVPGVLDQGVASRPTPPPNRCNCCNKKVGPMGFKCKCGSTFCSIHRYPESHECSYDFKEIGRQAIAKANPLLKSDKMQRF